MKYSYNWLNQYFDGKLPEAKNLAEKVGLHSFELEGVEEIETEGQKDFLIDWDVLPNRSSDCLCYDGMVKEISAVLDLEAKDVLHMAENVEFSKNLKTSDFVSLDISDANKEKNKVLRATKKIATNVKIAPSPKWLAQRLEAMGQKSINNVVDITNYVMFVTGQPVHAFDFEKLSGKEKKTIFIKHAKNEEILKDLSGTDHTLGKDILVIADEEKSLDIAGVKGGDISGIDENTKTVLMSVVNFEYENIRNTSGKLKLQTDASKRYENEVPTHKVLEAQKLFGYLLQELAGAEVSEETIDIQVEFFEKEKIAVSLSEINSLLGLSLNQEIILEILKRLKFEASVSGEFFEVFTKQERPDVKIKQDLIEEIGRIYGYENIEAKPIEEGFKIPKKNILKENRDKISDLLVSLGFFEVYNRSIVKSGDVELANSLNANATCLRNNLLKNLKTKTEKNLTHEQEPKMFEIGKVFTGIKDGEVEENFSFAGCIGKKKIKQKQEEEIFYQTKGILEKIFEVISVKNIEWKKSEEENFVADIFANEQKLGSMGINFWEINLEKILKNIEDFSEYKKVSKYPKIERDVAFFVPQEFEVAEAEKIIKELLPQEAQELTLFDIYKDTENQKKSFAFRIVFQSTEKTLSDEFANEIMEKVYSTLEKNNFEIR